MTTDFVRRESFVNGSVVEQWVPNFEPDPLLPTGWLWSTLPRMGPVIANQAPLTSGKLYYVAIYLPAGFTVTNVIFVSATQAAVNPANWWFALLDNAAKVLAVTADQTTTAWAANTATPLALTTPYITTRTGLYYLGIMVNAATPPSLYCASLNGNVLGFVGAFPGLLTQVGGAGLTTPAAVNSTPFALASANVVGLTALAGTS